MRPNLAIAGGASVVPTSTTAGVIDPLLDLKDLRALGISFHRSWLRKLMRSGEFPMAIKLGASRIAWRTSHVREWLDSRPAAFTVRAVQTRARRSGRRG